MSFVGFWKNRPRLATIALVAVAAALLLMIPVSYERTVGQQVSLNLSGGDLNRDLVRGIAGELKSALQADAVNVAAYGDQAAPRFTLVAKVAPQAGKKAAAVVQAFAHTLEQKGYKTDASVVPVKEKVSGSVYAMVSDNVIQIETGNKSATEIEAEIAQKLAQAGIPDAQVSVTRDGDNKMEVRVTAEHTGGEGAPAPGAEPNLAFTINGQEPGATKDNTQCRVMKTRDENGEHVQIEVTQDGKVATTTIDNAAGLSTAELAGHIQAALAAQGVNVNVNMDNGRIQVTGSPAQGAQPSATEKKTWGAVKKELGNK